MHQPGMIPHLGISESHGHDGLPWLELFNTCGISTQKTCSLQGIMMIQAMVMRTRGRGGHKSECSSRLPSRAWQAESALPQGHTVTVPQAVTVTGNASVALSNSASQVLPLQTTSQLLNGRHLKLLLNRHGSWHYVLTLCLRHALQAERDSPDCWRLRLLCTATCILCGPHWQCGIQPECLTHIGPSVQ